MKLKNKLNYHCVESQKGFTLIEVLIAVIVLSLGLLGIAALQATSLSNNLSAYKRSQATQLSYDIADRMRSNTTAVANYITPSPATCPNGTNPCTACTSAALTCTPQQLAQKDLFEWNRDLSNIFGAGSSGTITQLAGVYTVSVNWDDDKDVTTANLSFQMRFRL